MRRVPEEERYTTMRAGRPNFLFIITDQQRADHLGCYGNPLLRTPNIDSIAARGWRFEHFYVASAVCQPNRNTIMTGRMSVWEGAPFGELYDLENDPGEIVNLWGDPAHVGTRRALAERMLWKMIELQDRSPSPVGEA